MVVVLLMIGASAFHSGGKLSHSSVRQLGITHRTSSARMGGPSGLPRMPIAGWKYTQPFNPSMEYEERIATLYRDLEITLGTTDKPNERLALAAVRKLPDLINPQASSRWVFFRSKDILVSKLGSEQAAISLMSNRPDLLLCPRYDGLSPSLQAMLEPQELAATTSKRGPGAQPLLIAGTALVVGAAALVATSGLS
jgi:hypothetical protein